MKTKINYKSQLLIIITTLVFAFTAVIIANLFKRIKDLQINENITDYEEANIKAVKGNGNVIGDIVKIGTERFYVINYNDKETTLLAMYNLFVGGDYSNGKYYKYESVNGLQNSNMKGLLSDEKSVEHHGTIRYSDKNSNYDESVVKEIVDEYSDYLYKEFKVVNQGRLITLEDLEFLNMYRYEANYNNEYKWLFNSSYWTSSPAGSGNEYYVYEGNGYIFYTNFYDNTAFGVRPVITISSRYLN